MKAVPKVNTEGLYIEDTLVDDAFNGVVPFYADPPAPELSPETDSAAEDEQPDEPEIAGYIVGVPVTPGLYLPRFDLASWDADSSGEPADYWSEGLTEEEIEALHPPAEPTEMELLRTGLDDMRQASEQQQEKIDSTDKELLLVKSDNEAQREIVNTVGVEQVKQDLSVLDLKQQNAVLGAELVKKDIALLDLYNQNQILGQMLAALELRLLAKGGDLNV